MRTRVRVTSQPMTRHARTGRKLHLPGNGERYRTKRRAGSGADKVFPTRRRVVFRSTPRRRRPRPRHQHQRPARSETHRLRRLFLLSEPCPRLRPRSASAERPRPRRPRQLRFPSRRLRRQLQKRLQKRLPRNCHPRAAFPSAAPPPRRRSGRLPLRQVTNPRFPSPPGGEGSRLPARRRRRTTRKQHRRRPSFPSRPRRPRRLPRQRKQRKLLLVL
mmetsp:Transcript_2273/g.7876  ORF Transcript_2273/g.7876 Transcript_2273/m.7876 type:complete len:217 (-) Transcript_2273:1747-2397(-)